jgi:hypothetical protein
VSVILPDGALQHRAFDPSTVRLAGLLAPRDRGRLRSLAVTRLAVWEPNYLVDDRSSIGRSKASSTASSPSAIAPVLIDFLAK